MIAQRASELSTEKIEITPEMIEARTEVVWRTPIMDPDDAAMRQMVADVFRAMLRVKAPARPGLSFTPAASSLRMPPS
jgi:hypothetical protein